MAIYRKYHKRQRGVNIKDHFLYDTWNNMMSRCYSPKNKAFKYYGARNIKVDESWHNFDNFIKDVEPSYKDNTSLDRINNNKNYSKENFRWANKFIQANNKTNNRLIKYNGIEKTISEWARFYNIKSSTFRQRFYVYLWDFHKCINFRKGGY